MVGGWGMIAAGIACWVLLAVGDRLADEREFVVRELAELEAEEHKSQGWGEAWRAGELEDYREDFENNIRAVYEKWHREQLRLPALVVWRRTLIAALFLHVNPRHVRALYRQHLAEPKKRLEALRRMRAGGTPA